MTEQTRLASLRGLHLLDTPPDKAFDDLAHLASAICNTPISVVSLIDEHRQWSLASIGGVPRENPRDLSFCSHAMHAPGLFTVPDATADPRFSANPFVIADPGVRFYAGVPLHGPGGAPIGTLCVVDTVPRDLTPAQCKAFLILGAQVQAQLDLRARQVEVEAALAENQRLCDSLQSSADLFLAFMHNAPFATYIKDSAGAMRFYNRFLAQRFAVDEQAWLGQTDHQLWPADMADAFRKNDLAVLDSQLPVESEESSPAPGGGRTVWKSIKFPYEDSAGHRMIAGISIDVTHQLAQQIALEDALREKGELVSQVEAHAHLLQSFMDHTPNNTYIKDSAGRYVFYNQHFARFFGIGPTTWIGLTDAEVRPQDLASLFRQHDHDATESDTVVERTANLKDAAGHLHLFRSIKFSYADPAGGKFVGGVAIDITDQVRREESLAAANLLLEFLATTDGLTGLSNRRVFGERAAIEFAVARRKDRPLSLLLLDIDDFKRRNDTFGHAAGDDALRTVGAVLQSCLRTGDLCARIGGEEFAFLLPDTDSPGAHTVAHRALAALRKAPHGPAPLTLSIGISTLAPHTHDWEQLLAHADTAMYNAKRLGKNRAA